MENKEISPLMTGKLHKHRCAASPSIVSPGKWPVRAEQPLYYGTASALKRMSDTELWSLRFGELANTLKWTWASPSRKVSGQLTPESTCCLDRMEALRGKAGFWQMCVSPQQPESFPELTTVSRGICSNVNDGDFWWCVIKCINPGWSLSLSETMHHFQIILHQYKSHSSNITE